MRHIAVVRHGDERDDALTEIGRGQIRVLAQALRRELVDKRVALISSTRGCALETANIIGEDLQVPVVQNGILISGPDIEPRNWTLVDSLEKKYWDTTDAIVLVTHFEYSRTLPETIARRFALGALFPLFHTDKGKAWLIDIQSKRCDMIPA